MGQYVPETILMRQTDRVHCNCNRCFFCLHGLTEEIDHKRKNQKAVMEYSCSSQMMTNKRTTDRVMLKYKKGKKVKNRRY